MWAERHDGYTLRGRGGGAGVVTAGVDPAVPPMSTTMPSSAVTCGSAGGCAWGTGA